MKPEIFPSNTKIEQIKQQTFNSESLNAPKENLEKLPQIDGNLDSLKSEKNSVVTEQVQNTGYAPSAVNPDTQLTDNSHNDVNNSTLIAADSDKIEEAWIQKAKDIVTKTKNDPYSEEEEVVKLRKEYRTARFGDRGTN